MIRYTIRVYGIWINEEKQILLSDERIGERSFTKFPGGGMEKGEGTIDCLRREWKEELNVDIEIISHFYTTDFYQSSAFHEDTQVMSIYYLVKPIDASRIVFAINKNNFKHTAEREESVRFIPLKKISETDLTFPIDKQVVRLLQKEKARK